MSVRIIRSNKDWPLAMQVALCIVEHHLYTSAPISIRSLTEYNRMIHEAIDVDIKLFMKGWQRVKRLGLMCGRLGRWWGQGAVVVSVTGVWCGVVRMVLIGVVVYGVLPLSAMAQLQAGIAITYDLSEDNAGRLRDGAIQNGNIVFLDFTQIPPTYRRARNTDPADKLGVRAEDALLVLRTATTGVPIIRTGVAVVQVSSIQGPITVGEEVAVSDVPGVGARAVDNDRAVRVGTALESFGTVGETTTGSIRISLDFASGTGEEEADGNARNAAGNDVTVLDQTLLPSPFASTVEVVGVQFISLMRYVIAGTLVLASLFFAYRTYQNYLVTGVEAVGRNPLARKTIQRLSIVNIVVIVFVSVVSVILGFFIIR